MQYSPAYFTQANYGHKLRSKNMVDSRSVSSFLVLTFSSLLCARSLATELNDFRLSVVLPS